MSADRQPPLAALSTQVHGPDRGATQNGRSLAIENPIPPLSCGRLWMHRLAVLLFVFFCAILGVILIIFPWRDEWATNSLLFGHPGLQDFFSNGFVRGLCSGLGLLDIWIGFWEAIHYHE